ncbi:magnesium transporter [Reinekea blandensis]|uniref:Magnesium transporter, putative n=1 Tax=Reinekea blandensis MED297 TaxID=314283 RepID=A4BK53_9GAMM|nr:magnesium transporter [Reinekea blandensis]EAR07482.1 magnesium transporter, putative [Reinekea sp. MED297] [Reinekea blandensis MED297]
MAEDLSTLIEDVIDAGKPEQEVLLGKLLNQKEFDALALLLESLPQEQRLSTWQQIPPESRIDILVEMRSDPRESLLDAMSLDELDALFKDLDAEDLVELTESLPPRLVDRALLAMDERQRKYYEVAQQYADNLAGHWIDHHLYVLPQNAKVRDALRLMRRELPEYVDAVYLVNRAGHFSQAVRLGAVIGAPDHVHLTDLVEPDFSQVRAEENALDAALKVQRSGYSALPLVDESGALLGRLDIGVASEIVNEYYEGQIMAGAGMDEDEDLFSPVVTSAKNRAVWLGINLMTAFAAAWFIGLFEATLQEVVALAVLMPVVASMGGIAGSQTLTLIIRGLALGQVSSGNRKALLVKELRVGGLNGAIWSLVVGIVVTFWFSSPLIGFIIALAILMNIVAAAFSGVVIPIILDKLRLDPALSGSVVLTTVTDIVGFVAFLGIGTLILL